MAEETGSDMNAALTRGMGAGWGMGEALARDLYERNDLAYPELSLLLQSHHLGIPYTLHPALGAEIIHQHPAADGAAIGATGHHDFRRLAGALPRLDDGGVVINVGSAVVMPEVFLKALTVARNLHAGTPGRFTACNLDMQAHYRTRVHVVERPTRHSGGRGFHIMATRDHGAAAGLGDGGAVVGTDVGPTRSPDKIEAVARSDRGCLFVSK
jgi:hypothetical protein